MSIEIKHLTKRFNKFTALNDINLEIKEGEFVAILGPSGCGKTTLLRLLAGFDSPSDGQILMNNKIVSSPNNTLKANQRDVAMVFQNFALWPHMTVAEHIQFPLRYDRFARNDYVKDPKKRVDEVISIINLEEKKDRFPSELSGGQKQRVALGRAIAPEPKLLLMDEPLSALDAELRIEMRREIQKIHHHTNAAIVYVTHDQSEALAMADRIIVMNMGRVEQVGTPEEIYYNPETVFVSEFVSKANLVRGSWSNEGFRLENSKILWPFNSTPMNIRQKNFYLLRPEEITLDYIDDTSTESNLVGRIETCQFQGQEYRYTLETRDQILTVVLPIKDKISIGEEVVIIPRINEVK